MIRAAQSGMNYDFFMYVGKHRAGAKKCGAEESVLRLVEQLPKKQNYWLFFNNWFSTIRSSCPEVFCKKVFSEISQNSQENTCARVSFLTKLQA